MSPTVEVVAKTEEEARQKAVWEASTWGIDLIIESKTIENANEVTLEESDDPWWCQQLLDHYAEEEN